MPAFSLSLDRTTADPTIVTLGQWELKRRHVLMLVLAVAVLWMGARRAELYNPPGVSVNLPSTQGHVIT